MTKRSLYKVYRSSVFAAIVGLITFVAYLPSLRNGFVNWDDNAYVYNNLHIRFLDLDFFKWAFFQFSEGNWHPLTWISHALDYAIWGLNPIGHHMTNAVLHTLNTFIVVLLAGRLIEIGRRPTGSSPQSAIHVSPFALIAATAAGLLFGLHPLHVESVAWVSERKDLLCALFFLLSLMMYIKYIDRRAPQWPSEEGQPQAVAPAKKDSRQAGMTDKWYRNRTYHLSLVFFMLALMSKPMAITLPVVLLILDFYPLNRLGSVKLLRAAFIEKLPFFALSIISAILTLLAQKSGGAIQPLELYPLSARALVALKAVIMYIWKMVFPAGLLPYYAYPQRVSILSVEYLLPAVAGVVITVIGLVIFKKRPLWLSVWGYYVLMLVPVLGLVQVGTQSMADRYTYLPSLGPFLLAGLIGAWWWAKLNQLEKWGPAFKFVTSALAISLCFVLLYSTVRQIAVWRDSLTLWTYVIEKGTGRSSTPYVNRGLAYREAGRLDLALDDFNVAIALDPKDADAYNNSGIVLNESGRFDQAIEVFNRAVTVDPSRYITYYNRGSVLKEAGQYDPALDDFNKSIMLNPSYADAYVNRGLIFEDTGRPDRALEDYSAAIRVNPLFADAYINRGLLFEQGGQPDRALEDLNTAIRLNSASEEAYNNRGLAFEQMGQLARAIEDYGRAIAVNSFSPIAYSNRGIAFSKMGRSDEAMRDFQKACELGSEAGCEALKNYKTE